MSVFKMKGILTILMVAVCLAMVLPLASGDIIIVDDDGGSWADYTKIQDAINGSKDGDTIRVFNGSFQEHLMIDISISLIGNGSSVTILNGGNNSVDGINISADWVNVTGFSIINSGNSSNYSGIALDRANHTHISNNNISDNWLGLSLFESSMNDISNNSIENNWPRCGIELRMNSNNNSIINNSLKDNDINIASRQSWHNRISDNKILSDYEWGIILYYSNNHTIFNNTIYDPSGYDGLQLDHSNHNAIFGNNFSGWDNGILFDHSGYCDVFDNVFTLNYIGILIRPGLKVSIYNNSIYNNKKYGISLHHSDYIIIHNNTIRNQSDSAVVLRESEYCNITYNEIYNNGDYAIDLGSISNRNNINHNNFHNNTGGFSQASDHGDFNNWDDGSEGNYWNDWDGNGSYSIYGNSNSEDRYPLMDPNGSRRYPRTWIVDDDNGSWADFTSIQDAINASFKGDSVLVYSGVYHGRIDLIQSISLIGNGSAEVYINGSINLLNSYVSIDGFRMSNRSTCLRICGHSNLSIFNCVFNKNCDGIWGWGNNVTISSCIFMNSTNHAIRVTNTNHIEIDNCKFINNYGIGIWVYKSSSTYISNCVVRRNGWTGIHIEDSDYFSILRNEIEENNKTGILIQKCRHGLISNNLISRSTEYGIEVKNLSSDIQIFNNIFLQNNIIGLDENGTASNTTQALEGHEEVAWDNGSVGNYWSDYNGTDLNRDGIGDTPYFIAGVSNAKDRYPLMDANNTKSYNYSINITTDIFYDGYLVDGKTITVTINLGAHSGIPHESNFTVRLKVLLNGEALDNYTFNLTIPSGYSNRTIEQNVTLNGTGEFTFEAEIFHGDEEVGSYTEDINIVSPSYTFSLTLDRLTSGADPGDEIEYKLAVENRGNVPQTIRLTCSKNWVTFSNGSMYLLPDSVGYSEVIATVPTGASGSVNFTIVAKSYSDDDKILNSGNARVTITLDDDDEDDDPERILWVFIGVVIVLATGILIGTEIGLYALMTLLMPLYSRIKGKKVLDNFIRGQIYGFVAAHPGATYNQIKRTLHLQNGVFAYHVHILDRENMIRTQRDGIYTRFYPAHTNGGSVPVMGMRADVLRAIRKNPGITQKEVTKELKISNQLVSYHVMRLKEKELLESKQKGRRTELFTRKPHGPKGAKDDDFLDDDIILEEEPVMGSIPVEPFEVDEENT